MPLKFDAEIVDFHKSKFYDAPFEAKLIRMYGQKKEDDSSKEYLYLIFEDKESEGEEKELRLWGLEKSKRMVDPKDNKEKLFNDDSTAAGRYLASLKKCGVAYDISRENGKIEIGTKPDLTGKYNKMAIVEKKTTTKDDKTTDFIKWGLESYEGMGKPAISGQVPQQPVAPKADATAMMDKWEELVVEHKDKFPLKEAGIIDLCNKVFVDKDGKPDKAAREPYSATRKAFLRYATEKKPPFMTTDGDGKYSVA